MNQPSQLLSTGGFAKLMGIKKDTLLHYDKIGIFQPEIRKNNGYRYYSIFQSEAFSVILTLKELNMSLKAIKDFTEHRTPQNLTELLNSREKDIDQKIEILQTMKYVIQEKRKTTEQGIRTSNFDKVSIEKRASIPLLITKTNRGIEDEKAYVDAVSKHYDTLKNNQLPLPIVHGMIMNKCYVEKGNYSTYDSFYTRVQSKEQANFILEEGNYLTCIHKGHYEKLSMVYQRLLEYAEKHLIVIDDFFVEEYLIDELSVSDVDQHLCKVSIRVLE
ncbi:DNA-binding transcriptional regulator, MerR family [Pelagirhabdus alkalitolerans]|uniref:DNA-binding transcriptional regulator, MerR family n=1 Tax=Pelagirhabdus alkalitolerans TaxID=1612202 RepID=A0A1G6JX68_9BACI|nr:MerR family transcriptional regulator [Pelagirhabdus alkalitolerans]SDC23320.1 DNA-binding transcriptional regulator, MerR family [Pelagirhabdus alkalitolerans]